MATGRIGEGNTAIQPTIVDAKGDLIAATAADTPARLAVGSDGETLVADSSKTTGLAYIPTFFAGKNKIINGDFGVWQRGTTFTSPANSAYTSDRWRIGFDGTGTCTVSRQSFTAGTAPVPGYEGTFFLRHLVTAAGTTTFTQVFQPIEDVRTFAGQTVTFSFWAKADTARSSFIYAEQFFGSGGSATVQYLSMGSASLTTSWQRFSFTVVLSSISGKTIGTNSSLNFYIRNGTTLNATLDLWGVQLEAGSTASAFQTATGTIQGELAACQRYYQSFDAGGGTTAFGQGFASSTTAAYFKIPLLSAMRVTPTTLDALSLRATDYNTGFNPSGSFSIYASGSSPTAVVVGATTFTGLTQFRTYFVESAGTTTSYLRLGAEL